MTWGSERMNRFRRLSVSLPRFFIQHFPCLLPSGMWTWSLSSLAFTRSLTWLLASLLHWQNMGQHLKDGQVRELFLVMRGILTVPNGSAYCERVFSCVRKNRTSQRSSLAESTMESLLALKSAHVAQWRQCTTYLTSHWVSSRVLTPTASSRDCSIDKQILLSVLVTEKERIH